MDELRIFGFARTHQQVFNGMRLYAPWLHADKNTKSFGDHYYQIVTEPLNYSNATVAATKAGGYVAIVDNADESAFLSNFVANAGISNTVAVWARRRRRRQEHSGALRGGVRECPQCARLAYRLVLIRRRSEPVCDEPVDRRGHRARHRDYMHRLDWNYAYRVRPSRPCGGHHGRIRRQRERHRGLVGATVVRLRDISRWTILTKTV